MKYVRMVFLPLLAVEISRTSVEGQDERERADRHAARIRGIIDRVMEEKMEAITELILAERTEILSAIVEEQAESGRDNGRNRKCGRIDVCCFTVGRWRAIGVNKGR